MRNTFKQMNCALFVFVAAVSTLIFFHRFASYVSFEWPGANPVSTLDRKLADAQSRLVRLKNSYSITQQGYMQKTSDPNIPMILQQNISLEPRCRRGIDYTGRDLFRSLNTLKIPRPYDAFAKEGVLYMVFLSRENRQGLDLNENSSEWRCTFPGGPTVNGTILNEEPCMTGRHVQVVTCGIPRSVSDAWNHADPRLERAQFVAVTAFSRKKGAPFSYDRIEFCRYPPAQEWRPALIGPGAPPPPPPADPQPGGHAVQLAACTMLRHEYGRNVELTLEWLAYHTLQGVEHFYIMSNGDTRALRALLAPHLREGRVEVMDWEWDLTSWVHQLPQVNACVYRYRGLAKWVAMLDVDEFFQVQGGAGTLRDFADRQDGGVGAVCAAAFWFRALPLSRPEMSPAYRHLVTEDFVNRIPTRKYAVGKCLFRPENVNVLGVHEHCGGTPRVLADDAAALRLAHYKTSGSVALYLRALYGGSAGNVTVEDRSMAAFNASLRAELLRVYPGGVPCPPGASCCC